MRLLLIYARDTRSRARAIAPRRQTTGVDLRERTLEEKAHWNRLQGPDDVRLEGVDQSCNSLRGLAEVGTLDALSVCDRLI